MFHAMLCVTCGRLQMLVAAMDFAETMTHAAYNQLAYMIIAAQSRR